MLVIADITRLVALIGIPISGLLHGWSQAPVFAVVFAISLVPRLTALPVPIDLSLSMAWLVAGWANVAGWYRTHAWIDVPIHLVTPGATTAVVYLLLLMVGLLPRPGMPVIRSSNVVLSATALGCLLAVLWEFYEFVVLRHDEPPLGGYRDTLLDLLMGCVGSLLAGIALVPLLRKAALTIDRRNDPGSAPAIVRWRISP